MTMDLVESSRPVATTSLDQLSCTSEESMAVSTAIDWAHDFLGSPNPNLGRKGPVCPYIRSSLDERLLYVTCQNEPSCDDDELRTSLRMAKEWFLELQRRTPADKAHLVTVLVILPHIDMLDAAPLEALHAELKDEFVGDGLMIGQFHPTCDAAGLWDPAFRPLRSPVPMLAIRDMVSSDLPFLVRTPAHAAIYLERFARGIPPHTRRFLIDHLVETTPDSVR